MKTYKVKQCYLVMVAPVYKDKREIVELAWIPEKLAILGKTLVFERDNNSTLWKVEKVYNTPMEISEAIDRSQDYKRTRKASDI